MPKSVKLIPYNRPWVRPFRPAWSWLRPSDVNVNPRRTSIYSRAEALYMVAFNRAIDQRRHYIMESLDRSVGDDGGARSTSGYGLEPRRSEGVSSVPHLRRILEETDKQFAEQLDGVKLETFPLKRLYSITQLYESVWKPSSRRSRNAVAAGDDNRGPFPFVDDRATVLNELTKQHIMQSRHRVNSENHPKWGVRNCKIRRRKMLLRLKRRSISQEAIRSLQSNLIKRSAPGKS